MVEVPGGLRGYGGGWRLDTVLAPPSLVLVRESGFPTARFDVAFRDPEDFRDVEGGLPAAKRDRVEAHFVNDFSGGNIFTGAARNFLLYQTAPRGADGLALSFVLETLTTRLVTGTRGYFSAHLFSPELNSTVQAAIVNFFSNRGPDRTVADAVIDSLTSRPQVWESALGVSLEEIDPFADPARTIDILTLKGGALARSLLDDLGRARMGALLAELRRRHGGETFTRADLVAAGREVGIDLEARLDLWLGGTGLPGFVAETARAVRIADRDDGSPRYQLLVRVRNDEPVPGLLRILYWRGEGDETRRDVSEPIEVDGRSTVEFGVVLSTPPTLVVVEPYLSLNRNSFRVELPTVDEDNVVRERPFEGVRELPWRLPENDAIVVDDLDDGFSVVSPDDRRGVRLASGRDEDQDLDHGLPAQSLGTPPAHWARLASGSAWGRYRHTTVAKRPGSGKSRAVFTSVLDEAGTWQLELHMPSKRRFFVRSWGEWSLEIVDDGGRREVTFDANAASEGWNMVGTFDLASGEVAVELSDKAGGQVVVADAIRWRPVAAAEAQP
jgi:hypothetical protein